MKRQDQIIEAIGLRKSTSRGRCGCRRSARIVRMRDGQIEDAGLRKGARGMSGMLVAPREVLAAPRELQPVR